MHIFPSLIAADPLNLKATLTLLDPVVDGYHIDIMDNHFVPNLTWGPFVVNAIATATIRPLWVHIMADKVLPLIKQLSLGQGSLVSFHIEIDEDIRSVIKEIRNKHLLPGLAICPTTALEDLYPYLELVDHILIMSVQPGFSGQQFLPETWERIKKISAYAYQKQIACKIMVDGGVNEQNIAQLAQLKVDAVAIANALFTSNQLATTYQELKNRIRT